ncbi:MULTISPECIES: hypothetical protein [Sphingomonadaceae]|jgi:hypothetical protein|uniref:Uncharacterized protein n=1 Tax=Novosphingobium silvae TaxID=2692619 RepID=A0A7X4K8X4_9SPHN|nr:MULTISPECIES: hypothetical protein [Sphingomonadaceae]MYL99487.1 hypothetical protein [Novosphingobium silvae]QDK35917.1 hypothetical protein DM450_24690 [Sphingomonas sp. IC081]GFE77957.1 hypothetical protein NTCA1_56060 [Novosphingobium sp. TCA1]
MPNARWRVRAVAPGIEGIRRGIRADVEGAFFLGGAPKRVFTGLIGAILMEQSDEWAVQHAPYMTLETMAPVSDNPIAMLSAVPSASPVHPDAEMDGGDGNLHHAVGHDHRTLPA